MLTREEIQAQWLKTHEENLAKGLIWRRYEIDDDFDASGKTDKQRDAYFKDHSAPHYDVEVIVEEEDSIYEEIVVSLTCKKN